jgi:phage terminase Nu1 subunit (DNA packaging protein)
MGRLLGKKEISKLFEMSWPTVLKLKDEGLPMKKIGGRWYSHKDLIDDFIKKKVENIL